MFAYFQSGPRRGRALAAILAMAAGSSLVVFAQDAPAPSAAPTAASGTGTNGAASENSQMQVDNDLGILTRILSLAPERLTALRKAIENVEKMPQAERDQLRREVESRMQSLAQLSTEIRPEMRQLSPGDSSILQKYFRTLYTEQLQALQARFQAAQTPETRKPIIEELLKAATAKGIKPDAIPDRSQAAGSRGTAQPNGRGGRNGQNGPGGPRGNGPQRPPLPQPK